MGNKETHIFRAAYFQLEPRDISSSKKSTDNDAENGRFAVSYLARLAVNFKRRKSPGIPHAHVSFTQRPLSRGALWIHLERS